MTEFIEAKKPYFALGMVVVEDQYCGFLALRPEQMIPPGVTDLDLNLGYTLLETPRS